MDNKNLAESQIEALKDVFHIATDGFEDFYKSAKEQNEKAVSLGNWSSAASSGEFSTAASSGYYSKAASSGDYSTAASSGDYSTAASSGNYSKAASSGNYSKAASSGKGSQAATVGERSQAASLGEFSKAASSGNYSKAASSGAHSESASSGDDSSAASSGEFSKAASSGEYSKASSAGKRSRAASSGKGSRAASLGDYSRASSLGRNSACAAVGECAAVKGDLGNLIMASEYKDGKPVGGLASIIDGKILKPNQWYIVQNGQWVPVNFTDDGKMEKIKMETIWTYELDQSDLKLDFIEITGKFVWKGGREIFEVSETSPCDYKFYDIEFGRPWGGNKFFLTKEEAIQRVVTLLEIKISELKSQMKIALDLRQKLIAEKNGEQNER